MTEVNLKYVEQFTDRHGKPRCYFRRGHGKRVKLPGRPGSPEFMRAYQDALEASANAPDSERHRGAPGTFDRLVEDYYQSTAFVSNRDQTRRDYRYLIDALLQDENIGHRQVAEMTRQHVDAIIAKRLNAKKPGKATRTLSMLRILLEFAVDRDWRADNPAARFKRIKLGTLHTWTDEEIKLYELRWPQGTLQRTAFDLLLCTGQRSGDVRRMIWGAIEGDRIRITQSKTGKQVPIPIHPDLASSLRVTPNKGGQAVIVMNNRGGAYSANAFRHLITDAAAAAGLPKRCVPHGLRKAAARRLAEAGCSSKQIQAITGHESLSEVERYTADAEQDKLARSALAKLLQHKAKSESQT